MMNFNKLLLFSIGILLLVTSYLSLTMPLTDQPPSLPTPSPSLEFTGKITYVPQEQGFYGITRDTTGQKYMPLNLADVLKQQNLPLREGLHVQVKAEKSETTLGIHLWGEYIHIQNLTVLNDTGEVTTTK